MRDITLLHPVAQEKANKLVELCRQQGFVIKIGETLRTVAEQDDLYAQGRTKPGKVVTNAKGSTYSSMHQWGVAFDFIRNDGQGAYNEANNFFARVGQIGKSIGLEWGGDWRSPVDKPHFQLADWGSTTSKLKQQYKTPEVFIKTWEKALPVGWEKDSYGWWYRNKDGSYPVNNWALIGNHWYLFNPDGYMCTGWHRWDGNQCDPGGGSGDWYFLDNTADGPTEGACWKSNENGAMSVWVVE